MEALSIDFRQRRVGWKDWFIQEPPVNISTLNIWVDKLYQFDIDPTFEEFEIKGTLKDANPVFLVTYLFLDDPQLNLRRVQVNSMLLSATSDLRCFKLIIEKEN